MSNYIPTISRKNNIFILRLSKTEESQQDNIQKIIETIYSFDLTENALDILRDQTSSELHQYKQLCDLDKNIKLMEQETKPVITYSSAIKTNPH